MTIGALLAVAAVLGGFVGRAAADPIFGPPQPIADGEQVAAAGLAEDGSAILFSVPTDTGRPLLQRTRLADGSWSPPLAVSERPASLLALSPHATAAMAATIDRPFGLGI